MTTFINKYNDTEKLGADEKNRQWQREFLMDRLRTHHPQHKLNYPELSKSIRMAMLEKRYALDGVEKSNLQKCLDSMQHCIKVTTRQGLVERLESLSRQLGLKFMEDSSGLFISSDMFFLEIILDSKGMLTDVKVHHECKIEQQSCSELVTCLLKGDFADFTNQLEGLSSIYQLNAEPKVKSKAFVALQAVETDLYNLFKWQSLNKDMPTLLKESPVGIVQKRRGGHPMKLTYFISSYNLLSLKSKTMLPLTMELIKNKDIGMNVSVHLEASSANKLQILPSVTFSKDNNFPIYSPLSQNNSTLLPATFVLRLNEPLPVCNSLLAAIGHTDDSSTMSGSVLHLTIQVASKGLIKKYSKELFVSLPDQNHCYFFTENKNLHGSIVTSVPFTEPSQVPKMLSALKQQALFYTFLSSCVRTDGKLCNLANTTMLEVNAISLHKISVALQHSNEDSLVSVEFEFKDISDINVKLFSVACSSNYEIFNEKLTKIAAATLSIPLTIRYLLKLWENERNTENGKFDITGSNTDANVNNNRAGNRCVNFRDTTIKYERNNGSSNENNGNSDNLFSRPTFFNTTSVPITSDLFSEPNLLNTSSSSNLIVNQFGIKTEQIKDFTSSSLQQEDFCKSPKSNIIRGFDSLGKKKNLQTNINMLNSNLTGSSQVSGLIEVRNFTKNLNLIKNLDEQDNKSLELQHTVSITPVLSNIIANNICEESTNASETNKKDKRLEIEIIPILSNVAIPSITGVSLNHSSSTKLQTSVKKKCGESNQHKADKKRQRKDNFSSARNKVGLKLIALTDSLLTVENMTSKEQSNLSNKKNINKSLPNISQHKSSISSASASGGKPNLTTLKSATISSKYTVLSNRSQKRKTERKDIHEKMTPFSVSIENELVNSKANESELAKRTSSNNKDITKNTFQLNIRKHGNLSTVINKLKKAQNSVNILETFDNQEFGNVSQNTINSHDDCINPKYMIKPSVNGMKLTINKTRAAESIKRERETLLHNQLQKTFPSSSLNICKFRAYNKKHTGLKPGVSSGPASKSKITVLNNSNVEIDKVEGKNEYNKLTFYKSHSSECLPLNKDETSLVPAYMGNGLSKSSNNLYTSPALGKLIGRDKSSVKIKLNSPKTPEKYCSTVRIHSAVDATKNVQQQISPKVKNAMEGLIKTLNTNFQIPKLSTKSSTSDELPPKKEHKIDSNNITSSKSIFNPTGVYNNRIKHHNDTNPNILKADTPTIKNICNDSSNVQKNIGKSEKDYFNNNRCKILNKLSKLQHTKISDYSDEINITKAKNQSNYISEMNSFKTTADNQKKFDYSTEINKTYDANLPNISPQKNIYSEPQQALSMHIIKTPMSSSAPLETSLLNSTCIEDDLMDEALIGIGSK